MKTRQLIFSEKVDTSARQGMLPGFQVPQADYEMLILPGIERVRPRLHNSIYSTGGEGTNPRPCWCGHVALMERSVRVRSREDFGAFLNQMISNLKEHPEGWSSTPLESFLAGLVRLVEKDEINSPILREVPWYKLAVLFIAAKRYREYVLPLPVPSSEVGG